MNLVLENPDLYDSRHAFSLVEMLVVVAILGVLLALLLPSFQSTTYRAKNAKSVANLRAVGGYLHSYASENGGKFPGRIEQIPQPDGTFASGLAWHARLDQEGYVANRDVFFNPKEKYRSWNQWVADPTVTPSLKVFTQAWIPVYGLRHRGTAYEPESLLKIPQPSKFFLVVESWAAGTQRPGYFVSSDPAWRIKIDEVGVANALFADGHVEAKRADYFLGLANTPVEEAGGGLLRVWPEQ